MTEYQHKQHGTIITMIVGATMVFCFVLTIMGFSAGDFIPATISLTVGLVLVLVLVLFGSLNVTVTDNNTCVAFGIGWVRFNFDNSEIQSADQVRNRWIYGWGIRWFPGGWLYNVSGLDAVEIKLKNGRRYRIGTDEPEKLKNAIDHAIHSRQ